MQKHAQNLLESKYGRWGILVLVGFILSVNYYFYDAFSTLKSDLQNVFNFSNTDYGLFSSFYSIPNTFLAMAVIGGIVLDKLGIRRTGFMFIFFMTLGALLTAYGASDYFSNGGFGYDFFASFLPSYSPELKMMLVGRFFFGLGAETSIVVVSKIIVKWFKGKDLALAFGLKVGFGRLGTFAALNVSPMLSNEGANLPLAIWFAAILVCIGLLAFIVYILFDIKVDQLTEKKEVTSSEKDKFSFKDITGLLTNRAYIFIAILCVTFYSAVFPFNQYAADFLMHKFGMSSVISGRITSLMPLGTLFFTPFFGWFIDRKGYSASAMIFGSLALVIVHTTFALTMFPPYALMILLGIAFSLVPAAMWPSMVKLVDDKQIGTAYGLMYSIQNLGLWFFPLMAGILLDKTNPDAAPGQVLDYTWVLLMFASLGFLGMLFAFLLKREDKKNQLGIEMPLNKKG
ncbi:MAG: MFS transporter [Carboxylicivirga sp.]|jgi:MFS family permease|nr:MFS transporter [Carboxylicivirga sp.]